MSRYILGYDTNDDSLRRRIRSRCRAYGGRQQYSLFVFDLSETDREKLIAELETVIDDASDALADVRLWSVQTETVISKTGRGDNQEPANVV